MSYCRYDIRRGSICVVVRKIALLSEFFYYFFIFSYPTLGNRVMIRHTTPQR